MIFYTLRFVIIFFFFLRVLSFYINLLFYYLQRDDKQRYDEMIESVEGPSYILKCSAGIRKYEGNEKIEFQVCEILLKKEIDLVYHLD